MENSAFLTHDQLTVCDVIRAGKVVNLGQSDGMQLPCEINICDTKVYMNVLKGEFLVYLLQQIFRGNFCHFDSYLKGISI